MENNNTWHLYDVLQAALFVPFVPQKHERINCHSTPE